MGFYDAKILECLSDVTFWRAIASAFFVLHVVQALVGGPGPKENVIAVCVDCEVGVFVRSLLGRSDEEEAKHSVPEKPIGINNIMKKRCVYCYLIEARNFLIQFWRSHPFALCGILLVIVSTSGVSIFIRMKPGEWEISMAVVSHALLKYSALVAASRPTGADVSMNVLLEAILSIGEKKWLQISIQLGFSFSAGGPDRGLEGPKPIQTRTPNSKERLERVLSAFQRKEGDSEMTRQLLIDACYNVGIGKDLEKALAV